MRAVVQRVESASVTIDGRVNGKIGKGFMVLIGIDENDTDKDLDYICDKLTGLRIFEDEAGQNEPFHYRCGRGDTACKPIHALW